jgi:SAM-dependent methyltransferase
MNPEAMEPFGKALLAFFGGDPTTELNVRRDDGFVTALPMSYFFRAPNELTPIENTAIDGCVGRVLDVGAGSGLHGLILDKKGFRVTSIDIDPGAVDVMKRRGLVDVHCVDVFSFQDGPFDTLLMLGHGIGMVETIDGLDRFLDYVKGLTTDSGQILLDSLDVRVTDKASDLAYHEANRREGRYIGEIRMQFEFQGETGPYCGWLQVDAETLSAHAHSKGWTCEVVLQEASGNYLARITNSRS